MSRLSYFFLVSVEILVISGLAGCTSTPASPQPVPLSSLHPYLTQTLLIIPSATQLVTQTPKPTSTPFIYSIARNDTMSSIARRFGVSLEALLAANPDVAPEALTVGQTLTIPTGNPGAAAAINATPAPLDLGPAFCKPSAEGTTCLVPVHNPNSQAVENVSLQITLYDQQGQVLASQQAALPLNMLPADQVLPAAFFFSGLTAKTTAQVQLLTSIRLDSQAGRYLSTTIQNLLVSIAWDGLSANVQGKILLPDSGKAAGSLWLVAVAYDAGDRAVGYRRWEWSGSLKPGESLPFALPVYSLGPSIKHVEILVEARP